MSSQHSSAVEELLARWESRNPGTPVRPVVQHAVDLGFTVEPTGGWGSARQLRLVFEPGSGPAVTLHADALQLAAIGADVRDKAASMAGAVVRRKEVQFPFDAVDPVEVLDVFSGTTAAKAQVSRVTIVRAVVAAVALVFVLGGAASSGFSGALIMAGLAVFAVGVGALVVGRAHWALIASRAVAGGAAGAGVVALVAGGLVAPATEPVASIAAAEPTASATSATSAAADEAATQAAEAALLQAETNEATTATASLDPATGLLSDAATDTAVAVGAAARPPSPRWPPSRSRAARPRPATTATTSAQAWSDVDRNGCDTRNDILARDLTGETFKPGTRNCVVLTGSLADPYSGRTIAFQRGQGTSEAVQIDHVVALSDAWQTGAQGWDVTTAHRLRQRPAQPARRRRPAQHAEGRRRRRHLAAAEQGLPVRLRRPAGRGQGQLRALDDPGRAQRRSPPC